MNIQVFSDEFVDALESELSKLGSGDYLPAAVLVERVGLSKDYAILATFAVNNYLTDYEGVRSKGIRRKKVAASASVPVASASDADVTEQGGSDG